MTIKIDMDGVIRDIIPTMLKIYNEECDGQLTANDIADYNVNTSFPNVITKKNKLATDFFFVDKAEDIFRYSPMCNGAKEAINMLHRAGHRIVICTWQFTHEAKVYTLEFLKANEIYYDDICFTKEKDLIKSDVIVDDNPEFLKADNSEKKICIDAAYNNDYKECEHYDSLYNFVLKFLGV